MCVSNNQNITRKLFLIQHRMRHQTLCVSNTKGKGKEKEEERKNITGIDRTGVIDYSLFSLTNYIN